MIKEQLTGLADLINTQRAFQIKLGNDVPKDRVLFHHVQTSIAHNVYQAIEFQEFLEADTEDRKEELIDYLLFLFNKYIYLGLDYTSIKSDLLGTLYNANTRSLSYGVASNIANLEQNDYMTLLRLHCTFKPWKVRKSENCAPVPIVHEYFRYSLDNFRDLANMTYKDFDEFVYHLERKMNINVDRHNNNY